MKQFQANNHNKANKELKSLDSSMSVKEEINHYDRKMYHVIGIKIEARPNEAKNKVIANTIQLHKHGFDKLEKNFRFLGYTKLIVLHDPTNLDEDPDVVVPAHQKAKIKSDVEKDVKAEMEAEIEKRVEERMAKQAKENDAKVEADAKLKEKEDKEVEAIKAFEDEFATAIVGTKAVLLAYANKHGIVLTEKAKDNDSRIKEISNWFDAKMEIENQQ